MIEKLVNIIAPHECLACSAEGALLCSDCLRLQRRAEPRCYRCRVASSGFLTCTFCFARSPLRSARAAYRYEAQAKDLVWKLKFGRARSAAAEMAAVMAPLVSIEETQDASRLIVTHIPTATSRVRMRGYDQAALLARSLSRQAGLPYIPLVARSGQRKQVGASRAERLHQLDQAFRPIRLRHVRGAHILLVDDVLTTGATLQAAARVLYDAGAVRVDAVVFAQA